MEKERIKDLLAWYYAASSGTTDDIRLQRELLEALTGSLSKAKDGNEFIAGFLSKALVEDVLRNVVEDKYMNNAALNEYMQRLRESIGKIGCAKWQDIRATLESFGEKYRNTSKDKKNGQYIMINGFRFLVPSDNDSIIGAEGQPLPAFFNLDANLSDPYLAKLISRWYAESVNSVNKKLIGSGEKIDALCFVEKAFSGLGAITLMSHLVTACDLPATVYRSDYWNPTARISGQRPLSGYRYCAIYDTIFAGKVILEVNRYLKDFYGASLKAAVVFVNGDEKGVEKLENEGILVYSYMSMAEIAHEIEERVGQLRQRGTLASKANNLSSATYQAKMKQLMQAGASASSKF